MSGFFSLFRRIFSRKEAPEPGSLAEERWVAEFSGPKLGRFAEVTESSYAAAYRGGALELSLKKPGLFAWTEADLYRYADFTLEAELELPRDLDAAGGLLFRYADENNFYAFLVSARGFFRLDVLFNGVPRPILAWTELPTGTSERPHLLRLIARGSGLTLLIDGAWAGEAVDEGLRSGSIAFAAQWYAGAADEPSRSHEGGEAALFRLRSLVVESRPVEVEAWYYRSALVAAPLLPARMHLATTFFTMGNYLAAAVELKKAEKAGPLDTEGLFLKAEVAIRLELYEEAQAALEACLLSAPDKAEAIAEKANLLYLRGRYIELRDFVLPRLEAEKDNATLWTLLGHARFNLGDYPEAAEAYGRAADLEPEQPLLRMNEARAWDQARNRPKAIEAYLAAAEGFYAAEADDDLALALGRLESLRAGGGGVRAIRAKALYRSGKEGEAKPLIEGLLAKGSEDSVLYYLSGLLAVKEGNREKALARFERALEREPAFPLYAFRVAESLFLLERPEAGKAIERALECGPEDGWILNLSGLSLLKSLSATIEGGTAADPETAALARRRLEAAGLALPAEAEPAINLAELDALEGDLPAALARLDSFPEVGAARNHAGNILVRAAQAATNAEEAEALFSRAVREYERAIAAEPERLDFVENLAGLFLELERYSDAEEKIRRALDLGGGPRSYLLAGNLALAYGEWPRAEASYRLGLETAPADPSLLLALGRLYITLKKPEKVEELRQTLEAIDPHRASRLAEEFLAASTETIACAGCGRTWRVPKDLPAQSGANIRAMPPDDSPAGSCPRCGKVFCIACRRGALVENRFTCPDCGEFLKLSDHRLRWLVRQSLRRENPEPKVEKP